MSPRAVRSWRDLRVDAGLTLRQVEVLSGLNRGIISQIERGRACATPDQATAILDVYRNPTSRS
jgi:transcriptional regulator with XRE-family HTH domain